MPVRWTVEDIDAIAEAAHCGQVDKIGVPYIEHVRAVAAGLTPFGSDLVMAGLLHDIVEDTDWTVGQLSAVGISARSLAAVEAVTNQPGVPYQEKIRRITQNLDAVLVKIADNAHNSHPDRAAQLPAEKRARLAAKYRDARAVLWPAATRADIEAIIRIVNPSLLAELDDHLYADPVTAAHDESGFPIKERVAAKRDPRYAAALAEIQRFDWPNGTPMVPDSWADILAKRVMAAVRRHEQNQQATPDATEGDR